MPSGTISQPQKGASFGFPATALFRRLAVQAITIHPMRTALSSPSQASRWSPDREHIVFASTRMGFKDETTYTNALQQYGEIFVMRFDSSVVQQLTDNRWEEGIPAWQPARR